MTHATGTREWTLFIGWVFLAASFGSAQEAKVDSPKAPRVTVGVVGRLTQVVLPGSDLEAIPPDRSSKLVLRVASVAPHGTARRYDFEYYGMEAGTFDLRRFLRRKDGSSLGDLPSLEVVITSQLAAGQVLPHPLTAAPTPRIGGYRTALWLAGGAWAIGLLALIFAGRKRSRMRAGASVQPATLGERLKPLAEKAMAGTLNASERAALERTVLAYWTRRLHLGTVKSTEAFERLRKHDEAGPLVRALEAWLHRPGAEPERPTTPAELADLLRPYQYIVDESTALDASEVSPGRTRRQEVNA